ncbi:hypothetical protein [Aquimarina pacifica]|uniref:hypothetical protein n=1 Tax=Aquimarina pacifica TaxID=1296415 RepID=UPI00046E8252|nr:hypothetical protein [Aquimarina pacifica]
MAIRLGNGCSNCANLKDNNLCGIHGVKVTSSYTCDSFEMKAVLKDDRNCETCLRYETSDCSNPQKAAPHMLCSHWAPQTGMA